MERSSIWIALVLASLSAIGCTNEGVGDPCIPEAIPCNAQGDICGYKASEAYIEASSVQCRSRLCIVYKLDNGTMGERPSDPRILCPKADDDDQKRVEGCVDEQALATSVYCTVRCKADDECPAEFKCEPVLNLGGPGIKGSYCVKSEAIEQAQ